MCKKVHCIPLYERLLSHLPKEKESTKTTTSDLVFKTYSDHQVKKYAEQWNADIYFSPLPKCKSELL